jgi:hypothetical protein
MRTITIILPEFPAGVAHITRHTADEAIQTIELDQAAQIVLAAFVQGLEIERTTDAPSGVVIAISEKRTPNRFGIGAS